MSMAYVRYLKFDLGCHGNHSRRQAAALGAARPHSPQATEVPSRRSVPVRSDWVMQTASPQSTGTCMAGALPRASSMR